MSNGGFDPSQLMQQARELQGRMQRLQEELRLRKVEATVGGGMVHCEMNGQMEVTALRIDPQALDPRDIGMLQDLIIAAVNEASRRARELVQAETQKLTGMPIGDLFGGSGG